MFNWIKNILSPSSGVKNESITLRNEIRKQDILLQEKDEIINKLSFEIKRQRENKEIELEQKTQSELTLLFSNLSSPISQLMTQAYLVELDKPVQNRDIISVVNRLFNLLKESGIEFEGIVGTTIPYDPDFHKPLSTEASIEAENLVIIRFAGIRYKGILLQKALVEIISEGVK